VFGDTWSFSIGGFTIIHPAAFIDFVFSAKFVSSSIVISVLIPLLITLLFGREFSMIFTHQEISLSGFIFLLTIVLFEIFFVSRAWCRFLCPSGACLSLLGMKRIWRIRANKNKCAGCQKCRSICPYGLKPDQMEYYNTLQGAVCDNCGLCRDVCKTGAIYYNSVSI